MSGKTEKDTEVPLNNQLGGEINRGGSHLHYHHSSLRIGHRWVYGRLDRREISRSGDECLRGGDCGLGQCIEAS